MKNVIVLCVLAAILNLGCGEPRVLDGKYFPTYGLLNKEDNKDSTVQYEVSSGNIFWAVVLSETVVAPIYFLGFSMYNPITKK